MSYLIPRLVKQRSETLARVLFNRDGYNKYGLYHDDLIGGYYNVNNPTVAEAYRRLLLDKPDEHDKRVYRGLRASQLKIRKEVLPKEQWVSFEEDQEKGHYLKPYLEQIAKEDQEKKDFMLLDQ